MPHKNGEKDRPVSYEDFFEPSQSLRVLRFMAAVGFFTEKIMMFVFLLSW